MSKCISQLNSAYTYKRKIRIENFAQLRNAIFFTIKYRYTCKIKNWICASASVIYMIASKILPCRYEILILLNVVELEMQGVLIVLFISYLTSEENILKVHRSNVMFRALQFVISKLFRCIY